MMMQPLKDAAIRITPARITKDLPAFWDGSWREARIEMKGRYPRHVWPENPREADPTTRAKPRGT